MIYRVAMGLVGAVLVTASLYITVRFAVTMAAGAEGYVYAAVALAIGVAKIGLPLWRPPSMSWAAGVAVLWLCCFVVDTFFHSGYQVMTRGEAIEARAVQIKARTEAAAKLAEAEKKLARVESQTQSARGFAIVGVELVAAQAAAGDCSKSKAAAGDPCQRLARLQAEAIAAQDRETTAANVRAARETLSAMPEVVLYPEFRNAATSLRSAGLAVTEVQLAAVMAALFIVLFDFVPVIAFKIALTPPGPVAPKEPEPEPEPAIASVLRRAARGDTVPGITTHKTGALKLSQRPLASHLRSTPADVKLQLQQLAARRIAVVDFSSHGTLVRFVN